MAAKRKVRSAPAYRQKRNQGYVTLTDSQTGQRKDYPLGEYGSDASRERYHRLIAEWEASGRRLPDANFDAPRAVTVNDLCLAFAEQEGPKLSPSKHNDFWAVLRLMRRHYGSTPIDEFGPNKLRVLRERMIAPAPDGLDWCRKHANRQTSRIGEVIGWGVAREMVHPDTRARLRALEPLRKGKTSARESAEVLPVSRAAVDATMPHLNRQVAALVELQLLTGARPSELLQMRPVQIDMGQDVWVYRPKHKNEWRGKDRPIYLGPRAQEVISPFLAGRGVDRCLFSPQEAEEERLGRKPKKNFGEHYTADSYRRAIARACDIAFPPPDRLRPREKDGQVETQAEFLKRLTAEERAELRNWRKAHRWHPYQLRHTASTEIRRQFGLETAQLVLGHSSAAITDAVYAERDQARVVAAMRQIG